MGEGNAVNKSNLGEIGDLIFKNAEIIADMWMKKERGKLKSASGAHRDELKNLIPNFLRALGAELSSTDGEQTGHQMLARDHGIQRWQSDWKLNEVFADYQLLQITILEFLDGSLKRSLTVDEMKTIGSYIDEANIIAVTAFMNQSEGELLRLNQTLEERVIERTELAESRADKLKKAAIDIIKAKTHERQRIARILHDELQQLIVACKMRAEGLNTNMTESSFASELDMVIKTLMKALKVSKNLAFELKPPVDHRKMGKMLLWIQERMREEYDFEVTLGAEQSDITVGSEVGVLIYQSLMELIFNVLKHGNCKKANLDWAVENQNWMVLSVADQGGGFNPSSLEAIKDKSFGLNYIRERLEMIGGKLDVLSAVGRGTLISLKVPLEF